MDKLEIGEAIRTQRTSLKVSQQQVAQSTTLRRQSIIEIEQGSTNYGIDRLMELLDSLDLELTISPVKAFDFSNIKPLKE